jgi:multicomponent K+:H+ antiporter subunit E
MKLRFPWLWLALVAMWLLLTGTVTVGQTLLAMLAALAAVRGLRALQGARPRPRHLLPALRLAAIVALDIARSNIEVAAMVLRPGSLRNRSGFVEIPLELRDPAGLAVLACIITATPGTSWAAYDSRSGLLTMHVLDLADVDASIDVVKRRYERPLLEILG